MANPYKIFISSSITGQFEDIRKQVREQIESYKLIPLVPLLCEDGSLSGLTYNGEHSQDVINREILNSEIFVLFIGDKVGDATIAEFSIAKEQNKPIMIFHLEGLENATVNPKNIRVADFMQMHNPAVFAQENDEEKDWLEFLDEHNDGSYALNVRCEQGVVNLHQLSLRFGNFLNIAVPLLLADKLLHCKKANEFEYRDILMANQQFSLRSMEDYYDESLLTLADNVRNSQSRIWAFVGESMSGKTRAAQRFIQGKFGKTTVVVVTHLTRHSRIDLLENMADDTTKEYVFFVDDIDKVDESFRPLFAKIINRCKNGEADMVVTASNGSEWRSRIVEANGEIIAMKSLNKDDWQQCRWKLALNGIETQGEKQTSIGAIFAENSTKATEQYNKVIKTFDSDAERFLLLAVIHAVKAMWVWKRTNRGDISKLTEYVNFLNKYLRVGKARQHEVGSYTEAQVLAVLHKIDGYNLLRVNEDGARFEADDYIVYNIFKFQFEAIYNNVQAEKEKVQTAFQLDATPTDEEMCLYEIARFIRLQAFSFGSKMTKEDVPEGLATLIDATFKFFIRMASIMGNNYASLQKIRRAVLKANNQFIDKRIQPVGPLKTIADEDLSCIAPQALLGMLGNQLYKQRLGNYGSFNVADRYYSAYMWCFNDISNAITFYQRLNDFDEQLGYRMAMATQLLQRLDANSCTPENFKELAAIAESMLERDEFVHSMDGSVILKFLPFDKIRDVVSKLLSSQPEAEESMDEDSFFDDDFDDDFGDTVDYQDDVRNKKNVRTWVVSAFTSCKTMEEFRSLVDLVLDEKKYVKDYDELFSLLSKYTWNLIARAFSYGDKIRLIEWINDTNHACNPENYESILHRTWANNSVLTCLSYDDAIGQLKTIIDENHPCKCIDNYTCHDIIRRLNFEQANSFFIDFEQLIKHYYPNFKINDINYNIILDKASTRDDIIFCLRRRGLSLSDLMDDQRSEPIDNYVVGSVVRSQCLTQAEVEAILRADAENLKRKYKTESVCRPISITIGVLPTVGKERLSAYRDVCSECSVCEPECLRFRIIKDIILGTPKGAYHHGLTQEEHAEIQKNQLALSLLFQPSVEISHPKALILRREQRKLVEDERVCSQANLRHPDRNIVNEILKNNLICTSYEDRKCFLDEKVGKDCLSNEFTASILLNALQISYRKNCVPNSDAAKRCWQEANGILQKLFESVNGNNEAIIIGYINRLQIFADLNDRQDYFLNGETLQDITPVDYLKQLYQYLPKNTAVESNPNCEKNLARFIRGLYLSSKGRTDGRAEERLATVHNLVQEIIAKLKERNFLFSEVHIAYMYKFDPMVKKNESVKGQSHNSDFIKNLVHGLEGMKFTADEAEQSLKAYNEGHPNNKIYRTQTYKNTIIKRLSRDRSQRKDSVDQLLGLLKSIEQDVDGLTSNIAVGLFMMTANVQVFEALNLELKLYERFPECVDEFDRVKLSKMGFADCVRFLNTHYRNVSVKALNVVFQKWLSKQSANDTQMVKLIWSNMEQLRFPLAEMGLTEQFIRNHADLKPDLYTFINLLPQRNRSTVCYGEEILKVLADKQIVINTDFVKRLVMSGLLSSENSEQIYRDLELCLKHSFTEWVNIHSNLSSWLKSRYCEYEAEYRNILYSIVGLEKAQMRDNLTALAAEE